MCEFVIGQAKGGKARFSGLMEGSLSDNLSSGYIHDFCHIIYGRYHRHRHCQVFMIILFGIISIVSMVQ